MRGEERVPPAGDAEGALQLGADGKQRSWRGDREAQRRGRVAARAAQREGRPDDAVLAAPVDRAIVREEGVGDPGEPAPCVGVVDRDRLVGAVSAREDERRAEIGAEEMVQRRVGEHQPEPGRARRDGRCERRIRVAAQEDDRPGRQVRAAPAPLQRPGQRIGLGGEHCERLLFAVLARPQPGDRVLVARCTGEVIAADPLDGDDGPVEQQRNGRQQRVVPPQRAARQLWPAGGTADGSAWNRRSAGSSYSRRQSAQSSNPDIVVFGRS